VHPMPLGLLATLGDAVSVDRVAGDDEDGER
jgi:hypothetical protein